jgi:hypothetical protein
VLSILFLASCFVWLVRWAEYGRRRIYGPEAIDLRHKRERAPQRPGDDALEDQDRIIRRAWRDSRGLGDER